MRSEPQKIEKWEIVNLLSSLVDKSLVLADHSAGGMRCQLLETVRQYGREGLVAEDSLPMWEAKHFDYFQGVVEEGEPELTGPQSQEWFNRFSVEHENIRGALEFARVERPKEGLRFVANLWRFSYVRGHLEEGRNWLQRLLEVAPDEATPERAKAYHGAGVLSISQGDRVAAERFHKGSLSIKRELNDRTGIGYSLSARGMVAHERGEFDDARRAHEEALAIFRDLDEQRGISIAVINLSLALQMQGDFLAAKPLLKECISITRQSGDRRNMALALNNLGIIEVDQNEPEAAWKHLAESKATFEELGDPWGVALTLAGIGCVAYLRGQHAEAYETFNTGLIQLKQMGDVRGAAQRQVDMANMSLDIGDIDYATKLCHEALSTFSEMQDRWGLAHGLACAGAILCEIDPYLAAKVWGAIEVLRDQINAPIQNMDRGRFERRLAETRARTAAAAFEAAWEIGRKTPLDEIVKTALASLAERIDILAGSEPQRAQENRLGTRP